MSKTLVAETWYCATMKVCHHMFSMCGVEPQFDLRYTFVFIMCVEPQLG